MATTDPTSARSLPPPANQASTELDEPAGEGGSLKSLSFTFWKAFAREDVDFCRKVLRRLVELKNIDPTPFSDVLQQAGVQLSEYTTDGATRSGSGKYFVLPGGTPRKVVETWTADRGTTLMRIDPTEHCLSFDGDAKRDYAEGTTHFIACGQRQGTSADACAIGTHTDTRRPKMVISGPGYAVRHRASSAATKPKVMAGVFLPESALPQGVIDGGVVDMLEDLEAPPAVWYALIKACPSKGALDHWYDTRNSEEWFLKTVMERSSDDEADLSTPRKSPPSRRSEDKRPVEEVNVPPSDRESTARDDLKVDEEPEDSEQQLTLRPRLSAASPRVQSSHSNVSRASSSVERSDGADSQLREQVQALRELVTSLQADMEKGLRRNAQVMNSKLKKMYDDVDDGFDKVYSRVEKLEATDPGMSASRDVKDIWHRLDEDDKKDLASLILDEMDIRQLISQVSRHLAIPAINRTLTDVEARVVAVEEEFSSPQGAIHIIQDKLEEAEARRDTASSVRGGYIFRDQTDVEALVINVKQKEFYKFFLDVISLLTLAQDPFSTYVEGVKIHADAIKANFDSVLGSRIKLSFETPFPETILRTTDNQETAGKGGTTWAPRFATAALFEDQVRTGVHRQIMDGIEKIYEAMQKQVDAEFPIRHFGRTDADVRKIHTIITDHNRMGYRQATAFIESMLPIYKTFLQGGLSSTDSWERTRIYVVEFISSVQEARLTSIEATSTAAMIWGSFKATDLAEEFKRQKFIEHPKVVSILALTSIEREGKSVADAIAAAKGDKEAVAKIEKRVQAIETQLKMLKTKNPDLK